MNERTSKVIYGFRRPLRDGSTHVVLDPLSFLSRLAALEQHIHAGRQQQHADEERWLGTLANTSVLDATIRARWN